MKILVLVLNICVTLHTHTHTHTYTHTYVFGTYCVQLYEIRVVFRHNCNNIDMCT